MPTYLHVLNPCAPYSDCESYGFQSDTSLNNYLTENDQTHAAALRIHDDNSYNYDIESDIVGSSFSPKHLLKIYTFKHGMRAELHCPETGTSKPNEIIWKKENGSLNKKSANLVFEPIHESDSGVYTCYTINSQGHTNYSVSVLVYKGEKSPEIVSQNSTVYAGDTVVMSCASDVSLRDKLIWKKKSADGTAEILDKTNKKSLPLHLVLDSVTSADAGTYTCSLDSNPSLIRNSIHLKVFDGMFDSLNQIQVAKGRTY